MGLFGNSGNWTDYSLLGSLWKQGTEGDKTRQDSSSGYTSGIRLGAESDLEKKAGAQIGTSFADLMNMLQSGPGQSEVNASNESQKDFVNSLRSIVSSGGLPTDEDRRQANIFADDLFKPQMEALNQRFAQQNEQAARLSASLNRPINDPIIQAKLRQEQMRQSAMLGADRSAFVAQESRNSPFRRLELQGQLADAQSALASQAMANRMQLLNLGNALQSQERNWRLQTGERYGTQQGSSTQYSGGGVMGGVGAVTGFASGIMNIANSGMSAMQGGSGQSTGAYGGTAYGGGGGQVNFANNGGGFIPAGTNQYGGQMNDIQSAYMANRGQSPARASRLSTGGNGPMKMSGVNGGFSMLGKAFL